MYHSQFEQDKFINENIFKNKKNGYFVDVGAFLGIAASDTFFFENELNWDGICIEPLIEMFENLQSTRSCHLVNCCAYDKDCEVDFVICPAEPLSGISECMTIQHVARIDKEAKKRNSKIKKIKVKARTLNSILKEFNAPKIIDYLKIDTEGSEIKILSGIDFGIYKFKLIQVETNPAMKDEIIGAVFSYGYKKFCDVGSDTLFLPE